MKSQLLVALFCWAQDNNHQWLSLAMVQQLKWATHTKTADVSERSLSTSQSLQSWVASLQLSDTFRLRRSQRTSILHQFSNLLNLFEAQMSQLLTQQGDRVNFSSLSYSSISFLWGMTDSVLWFNSDPYILICSLYEKLKEDEVL